MRPLSRRLGPALLALMLAVGAAADQPAEGQMPVLELKAGEPLGDAMARSSMKIEVGILPDLQGLYLPPLQDWNAERYQIRLRGGADSSALIDWTPFSGTIWLTAGLIDQIKLEFMNFHLTRADSDDWVRPNDTLDLPAGDLKGEIEAIVQIYQAIMELDPVPSDITSCYHNSRRDELLEGELADSKAGSCKDVTVLNERLTPDALRAALTEFHAGVEKTRQDDPKAAERTPPALNLGQWWLANGNLVMMRVLPQSEVPFQSGQTRPIRLALSLDVREFYRTGVASLIATCFDQQAIFPDRILYTQEQAAHIVNGLIAVMYPPVVDGRTLSDEIEIQNVDWTAKRDEFWNDAASRESFCAELLRLQDEAGYKGPRPPLR